MASIKKISDEPALIADIIEDIRMPEFLNLKHAKQRMIHEEERRKELRIMHERERKERRERYDFSDLAGYQGGECDKKIPREVVKNMAKKDEDSYRVTRNDPTKRKDWPEFCRDFIGQNHGAIAQAMLELFMTDKEKFLRFILEMGKQGYSPVVMKDQTAGVIERKGDIYATLSAMSSSSGQIIDGRAPMIEEADVVQEEDAESEPNYDISLAASFADTSKAREANERQNLFEQFTKINNNGKDQQQEEESAGDPGEGPIQEADQ